LSPGDLAPGDLAGRLLAWYDRQHRDLPWRAAPGVLADPYGVWLSEIMLQQTTVATVGPYYRKFMAAWPRVEDLAAADRDAVLRAWAGLGYYARARNLHACAIEVAQQCGGRFPDTEAGLRALPGVGAYTAAAVAAIAFDRPATVVDGNVERVIARLFAVDTPLPGAKPELCRLAETLTPTKRPGDYAQAIMDLGATVCTPRKPLCILCPWSAGCAARRAGIAATLPARRPKPDKPTRLGWAFWLTRADGSVLLRRRPDRGLLGGMMEVPSTPWRVAAWTEAEAIGLAPSPAPWRPVAGSIRHTFTHFHLDMQVFVARLPAGAVAIEGIWVSPEDLAGQALPTVMRKLASHALGRRA